MISLPTSVRMVVFDDDPTGIQTVHSCLLVTAWDEETLLKAFSHQQPFFYVLTNTRAMTAVQAADVTRQAVEAVVRVSLRLGLRLICVSRSDSTLRGHFPVETDVMCRVLEEHGLKVYPQIPFVPAFIEAGRITRQGVHYMRQGDRLVPVAETEFARDNVFAYHHSRLTDYVMEKTGDAQSAAHYLIPADVESYADLEVFCRDLLHRMASFDGCMVIRCSSSLPRALSGIAGRPLLTRETLQTGQGVGMVVVGSHVNKTTLQLRRLLQCDGVQGVELPVERILQDADAFMEETLQQMDGLAREGLTPVVYTSRQELRVPDANLRQQIGQQISAFLVQLVRQLPFVPAWLIAKGGITSHDILTHSLDIRTAEVLGQILPGVPCVQASRFPYVIFPGNVGDEDALAEAYARLGCNPHENDI